MRSFRIVLMGGVAAMMLSGAAMAADMPHAAVAAAPGANPFEGAYVGVNVGDGWTQFQDTQFSIGTSFPGIFVGGQVGYNFVLSDNIVFGIEADADWNSGSGAFTDVVTETPRTDYSGSVTAHLGLVSGTLMPYILGGVAAAHETDGVTGALGGDRSGTLIGWTAGVGVASKLTDNLSAFLEARYTDYGTAALAASDPALAAYPVQSALKSTTIRAGLDWSL